MELRGPFDGFVEKAVRASTTCLIMADDNRYSVDARAAGRMVLVRSHAERIVVLLGDEVVADHPRQFRRDQGTIKSRVHRARRRLRAARHRQRRQVRSGPLDACYFDVFVSPVGSAIIVLP